MASGKRPSRRQVFAARAVQIRGTSRSHRRHSDKLFSRLPGVCGYKLDDKRRYFRRAFAAAFRAIRRDGVIWVELHHSKTPKAARRVLDALVKSGRLVKYRHRKDRCTRFLITDKFRAELESCRPSHPHRSDQECAALFTRREKIWYCRPVKITKGRHVGKVRMVRCVKKIAPKPLQFDRSHPVFVETTRLLDFVNAFNAKFEFRCDCWCPVARDFDGSKKPPFDSFLTAKFTANDGHPDDDFTSHGRLYTSGDDGYQTMREVERGRFFIDDQPCVELDYKCLHPRMAYNLYGLPCPGDCYTFLGLGSDARLLAKKTLNTMFNANSPEDAAGSFIEAIQYWNYEDGTRARKKSFKLNRAWKAMGKPKPAALLAAARQYHAPIADYFFNDSGMTFMRHDSAIALRVLHGLAVKGIPAACFHDSFLVPRPFESDLKRLMYELYFDRFGSHPDIEKKER